MNNNISAQRHPRVSSKDLANATSGQFLAAISPNIQLLLVDAVDVDGVNYVAGSEGKTRMIREFHPDGSNVIVSEITLMYQNATYPTKCTFMSSVAL